MAEADIVNFQSCCRLCLCEMVDSVKSIFDETIEDSTLSQKILHSLAIEMSPSDKLSTIVCQPCVDKITDWYNYKEECLENQKKLLELLPKEQTEVLPPITPVNFSDSISTNTTSNSTSLADISLQIKEEPIDHIDHQNEEDNHEDSLDIQSNSIDHQIIHQNVDQNDNSQHSNVVVKSEPLDADGIDEPMEEEFSEFPPNLSPQQIGELNLHEPLVVIGGPDMNRTCNVCAKVFSTSGNKKKHERMQHGLHNNISVATPIRNGLTNGEDNPPVQTEQQLILYGMGLKLLQTDSEHKSAESLTKIELSYIEKCKAMVNMHKSLTCACHNVPHQNLKGLLSHLRALRIWFPVFTCYNCMITFTDRSTFTRHISRCQSTPLDSITKLSNLAERSVVKTRLYQNFKCTICKFMFSFHEDFCKHVDLDHSMLQFPVHCPCGRVFENTDDYKDHVYVSCLVEYYCDICFITTKTLDDFQKHAVGLHDESEGFILLQDDNYKVRKPSMHVSPTAIDEGAILTGKRERKASFKTPIIDDDLDDLMTSSMVGSNLYTPKTNNRVCPICYKEYSSYKNMMRHYKGHKPDEIQQHQLSQDIDQEPQDMDLEDEESVYSCPDCGGMYKSMEWKVHLTESHPSKPCGECGKFFQFQVELDQHRSVHLNLKVYRDSKTQSYKSAVISPAGEEEEGLILACDACDLVFTSQEELLTHKLEIGHGNIEDIEQLEETSSEMDATEIAEAIQEPAAATTAKKYKCDLCHQEFNNYNGLWEHNRNKHPERKTPNVDAYPKKCKDCDKVCTTGAAYYRHRQIHEKVPNDAGATKAAALLKPKKEINDDESYHTCKRCFKVFSNKYNLKNHLKCHGININPVAKKPIRKAVCKVCQTVFDTNEELIRHKQDYHHSVETPRDDMESASLVFACDVCVMTFNSKIALKKHKEKHTAEQKLNKQVFCKYCRIPFDTFHGLSVHMQSEHDEKIKPQIKEVNKPDEYTCSICQKSFLSSGALTTHIGWHKRAQNDNNTKIMKNQPKIQQVNIKEEPKEEPKFQCATCLAELPNDTALQVHILEKHRSVSAIMLIPRCNTCNKDFATQDEYETHKRLHDFLERQKQHEQKMLMQQQDSSPQRIAQTVNKPKSFPCKHCNAAFSRSDTLGAHVRQFHKEFVQTEFKCHQCDRVFEKQNSLTIHLKVHEKQRVVHQVVPAAGKALFSCSICNMGFDLPKDLRTHTITAHPF